MLGLGVKLKPVTSLLAQCEDTSSVTTLNPRLGSNQKPSDHTEPQAGDLEILNTSLPWSCLVLQLMRGLKKWQRLQLQGVRTSDAGLEGGKQETELLE